MSKIIKRNNNKIIVLGFINILGYKRMMINGADMKVAVLGCIYN
jgi:hypothetical protein